ncbi:MAG TPA: hypothetical protein VKS24_23000 [Bradyrhizobium sp.]|nr:hypothetical protein [Bradyrhizobium sp.]
MPFNTALRLGVTTAALAMFFASPMTAAATSDGSAKRHHFHHARHAFYREHAIHRGSMVADREGIPYAPEYGFLSRVPPNAIRMPGYTFVPGAGILGASCDLPTSACTNEYRDVR